MGSIARTKTFSPADSHHQLLYKTSFLIVVRKVFVRMHCREWCFKNTLNLYDLKPKIRGELADDKRPIIYITPTAPISLHFSWETLLSDSSVRDFGKIGLKCWAWIHAPETEVVSLLCRPSFISAPDGEWKRTAIAAHCQRGSKNQFTGRLFLGVWRSWMTGLANGGHLFHRLLIYRCRNEDKPRFLTLPWFGPRAALLGLLEPLLDLCLYLNCGFYVQYLFLPPVFCATVLVQEKLKTYWFSFCFCTFSLSTVTHLLVSLVLHMSQGWANVSGPFYAHPWENIQCTHTHAYGN